MNRERQRPVLWPFIMSIFLVLSLTANIHLLASQRKADEKPEQLVNSYSKLMIGYLNGLEEELDNASENGWSDPVQLQSISCNFQKARMLATSILDLASITNTEIEKIFLYQD